VSITPQSQVNEYLEKADLPNSQKAVLWAQGITDKDAKAKIDKALAGGVKLDDYYLMKTHINTDGKSNISKEEATNYLNSVNLPRKQKALLWSLINNAAWWQKSNPYA
jgi:hypothetical protein